MNMSEAADTPRPDPRPDLARTALAEAMVDLITEDPRHEISISALCKRARVSRPTFYRWFRTPDDVLAFAITHRLDALVQNLPTQDQLDDQTPPQELTDLLRTLWDERALYTAILPETARYAATKAAAEDWLRSVFTQRLTFSWAGPDFSQEQRHTLLVYLAGGAMSVLSDLIAQEDLDLERVESTGRELWMIMHATQRAIAHQATD